MAKLTLKNRSILGLFAALSALDDPQSQPAAGQPQVPPNYNFSGVTIFALAKNHRKFKSVAEDIDKTRIKLLAKHTEANGGGKLEGPGMAALEAEYRDFLETDSTVEVHQIKESDLGDSVSKLPIRILSELMETVIVPA